MGNTNTNTARSRFNVGDRVVIRKDHHREPMPGVVVATSATMPVYRRIGIGWEAMPGGRIERAMVEAPGVDVRLDAVGYDSVSGLRVAAGALTEAHDDQVTLVKRAPRSRFKVGDRVVVHRSGGMITKRQPKGYLFGTVVCTSGNITIGTRTGPGVEVYTTEGEFIDALDAQVSRRSKATR